MLVLRPEAARHSSYSFPICTTLTRISANCDGHQESQLKVPVHKFAIPPISVQEKEASSAYTAVLSRQFFFEDLLL